MKKPVKAPVTKKSATMPAPRSVTILLRAIAYFGLAVSPAAIAQSAPAGSRHTLAIVGAELRLDGTPIKLKGLRTSAALMSDATTHDLIEHLDLFRSYRVNAVSVYLMGSRFTDNRVHRWGQRLLLRLDVAPGAAATRSQHEPRR